MTQVHITNLAAVTDAAFQREYQKLRPLLKAEAHIQKQLSNLDAQVAEVRAGSSDTDGYRATGTDVLWGSWESATRRQLNMELTRIRSQKITAMEELKLAFGKKQAVASLSQRLRKKHQSLQQRALLEQLDL